MSKKYNAIKKAVFYAKENPDALAEIVTGLVSDTVTSILINGADSIGVPSGDTGATEDYTTTVFSQYGDTMTGQSVTLALKESVTGVSISSGTVTVSKTAVDENFTLVATCGIVTAEKTVTLVPANTD